MPDTIKTARGTTTKGTVKVTARGYEHKTTQGARLPGWPEVNCTYLARDIGSHPMHVRGVLSGRNGTTLAFLERVGKALKLTPGEVVTRIIAARSADDERVKKARERWEIRQQSRRMRAVTLPVPVPRPPGPSKTTVKYR